MQYEWDEAKRASNIVKHGVDFLSAYGFDFSTAIIVADTRRPYDEARLVALGVIDEEVVHVMAFVIRRPAIRMISLRRANKREFQRYVAQVADAV